jgi:isochorismate pyruvate lyase
VKKPEDCTSIVDVRQGIDALDRKIIALIGERSHYVVAAAAHYKTSRSSVQAPERQRAMLAQRRRWAEEEGLSPDVIENIYKSLIQYFVSQEMSQWHSPHRGPQNLPYDPPTQARLIDNDSQ